MDVHIGAHVEATDGRVGAVTRVVVEPEHQTVTHIVVRGSGVFGVERLVAIEDVTDATRERLRLRISQADFGNLAPFDRTVEYTPPGVGDVFVDRIRGSEEVALDQLDIAEDEIAVRGGERVEATDGTIGRVDDIIVDPKTRVATHIVLREGHLWHARTVTIPVDAIELVERNVIHL